ncbi:MAG: DUF3849 domain-containing protein [Oscillospiraceae bacterium]|nr:DUF3849 domain-containing protein [Oscillospiraceae bacterium]
MADRKGQLAQQLYDRASQELDAYIADLKTQPPERIIDRAYQLSTMQDMVMVLESSDIPANKLEVLAALEHPLEVLYDDWLNRDDSRMGELHRSMEDYAGQKLRDQAELLFSDPKVPRYAGTHEDAVRAGEVYQYYANRSRDLLCLHTFEQGVSDANANHAMRPFVQKWTEDYGHDRCKFVLGYTVQRADWDKRYSPKARQDAQKYDYDLTNNYNPYSSYGTNAHPCLVNCAYELLMEQERGKEKQAPQKNEQER